MITFIKVCIYAIFGRHQDEPDNFDAWKQFWQSERKDQ